MSALFNVGDTGRRWVNQVCCLVDNGQRCLRQAGNASYSRRIQKTVLQQRLKLNLDHAARHIYICDYHKDVIQSARISTPLNKSTTSESGTPTNKFVTAPNFSTNRFQDLPIFTTSLPSYTTHNLGSTIILNQTKPPSASSSRFISIQTPIVNQPIRPNNVARPTIISNLQPSTSNLSYSVPNHSQPISYLTQSISSLSNLPQSVSNISQSISNAPQSFSNLPQSISSQSMSTHQQSAFKNVATSRLSVESQVQSYLIKPLSNSISGNLSQIRPVTTSIRFGGNNSTLNPVTYKIGPQIISTNLSNNLGPVLQLVPQNTYSAISPNTFSEISPNTFSVISRTTTTDSAVSSNCSFATPAPSNITAVVSSNYTRPISSNLIPTTSLTTANVRPVTFSYLASSKPLDIGSYVIDGSAIGSTSESHLLNFKSRSNDSNLLNLKLKTSERNLINSKVPSTESGLLNLKLKTSERNLFNSKLPTAESHLSNSKLKTSERNLINSKLSTTESGLLNLKLKTSEMNLFNSKLPTTESILLNLKSETSERNSINSKLPTTETGLLDLKLKTTERDSSNSKLDFSKSVEFEMQRDLSQPPFAKYSRNNHVGESSKSVTYVFDEPIDAKASTSNKLSSMKNKFLNTIGAKKKNKEVEVRENKNEEFDFESKFAKDNKKAEFDSLFPLKKSSFKKKSTSTPFYRKFFKNYSRLGGKLLDHTPSAKTSDNVESDSRKSDKGCDIQSEDAAKSGSKFQAFEMNTENDVILIESEAKTNSQNDVMAVESKAEENPQPDVITIESEMEINSQDDVTMVEPESRRNSRKDVIMVEFDEEEQNEKIQNSDSDQRVAENCIVLFDPDELRESTIIHPEEMQSAEKGEGESVSNSDEESEEEEDDEEESDTSQSASSEASSEAEEEEEEEEEDEESEKNYGPPPVHLNQLHIDGLRRYKQFFGVKTKKCRNKKELASQLQKHFSDLDVGEEEALSMFIYTVKTRSNLLESWQSANMNLPAVARSLSGSV